MLIGDQNLGTLQSTGSGETTLFSLQSCSHWCINPSEVHHPQANPDEAPGKLQEGLTMQRLTDNCSWSNNTASARMLGNVRNPTRIRSPVKDSRCT